MVLQGQAEPATAHTTTAGTVTEVVPVAAVDSVAPTAPEALEVADALAKALQWEATLPGLAVAVGTREQGIVFSEGYGFSDLASRAPATPLTRWRIGSVSKSLTAAGAQLLVERGRLDPDATVAEILPGWDRRPAGRSTVRQLAGHLGGIRHYREGEGISLVHYESVADALELFADDSLVAPPGEVYDYSTYGYVLLSALMARAAEEPYLDFMQHEVFTPLGLSHTGPDLATRVVPWRASFYEIRDGRSVPAPFTDNSYKWAGGGLLSTPEDLVRFGVGLLDHRLLSPAGVETLLTSQQTASGEESGYGMGFRPRSDWEGRRVVHHGGSSEGGRAYLLLYPDDGVVVAMAANRARAPLFDEEAQTFAHFFLDHGPATRAELDGDLAGAWALTATMGDNMEHEGSLRLHASGRIRGMLELGESHSPVRIVAVDRHGDELRLIGAGAHGVMNAWLEPSQGGWTGRWEYLGLSGDLVLREAAPATAATCSLHEPTPTDTGAASAHARARRVLAELRPAVRFTNAALPPMGLADRMERYRVPGLAVTVIDGGRPVWTCVAGVKRAGRADAVTRETLFQVKSVSKPVSAVAALRLVESGALVLDEPLSSRLISYRIPRDEHTRATEPTLRHLLSHAAGFTRGGVDSYRPDEPLPTLEESLEGRPPADAEPLDIDFTPGTRSRYSGGGYGVLQALLQDVTGQVFPDVVDSLVFTSLGMSHSLFPQPLPPLLEPFSADGHFSDGTALPGGYETLPLMAAGGLWSTAPDLARFVVAVSGAWHGESGDFLDQELAREMLTRQAGGRGLGFEVEETDGSLLFHHGGSGDGFKALIVGLPDEGRGAVILANGDGGGELRYELLRAIAEEYDWPAYRETATYTLATDVGEADLRRFEGTYVWNSGIASEVELRDGALHERFDEGEWTRLFPLSPTEFVSLMDVRYRFLPGLAGSYTLEMTDETGTYYAIPPQRLAEGVEGWRVVAPGGPAALDSIHFRAMGTGVHTTAGAPALYFHPDGVGRVPYEVGATFMQIGKPGSDKGLGLMLAGVETESGSLRHLLFRVRADGAYAIELREGGETTRSIRPWTRHEAVAPMSGQGGHNALRVRVATDELVFSVNETVVATVPSEELGAVEGVAGFFVGRAHDVHVDGFGITGPASASPPPGHDGTPSRELRFEHAGIELAGELRLPETANGPYPAIAFIHGSGESDRNHYWASRIGDVFTANGVAFLLPDKRGSGASGGDWRTADFHDLAGDALAAIERLRQLPEIDASRVGVLGFSQGGRIVSIVGTRSRELRFVVNVSGSAVPFTEQLDHEMRNTLRQAGLDAAELAEAMALHRTAERYLRGEAPWSAYEARLEDALSASWAEEARQFPRDRHDWRWDFFRGVIDFDPIPCWRRVEAPIFVVYGAEDEEDNVPVARSVGRLEAALAEVGHQDHTIRVLEDTGHGLWEQGTHPPRHREDFLRLLLDWIRDRIR